MNQQMNQHKSVLSRSVSLLLTLVALVCTNAWAQDIERVAVFEQWPGVSQVIAYRNRIWLVNSEPFRDNNSADVYSYSIEENSLRYERSLFSQDAGAPVIFDGLLHWPFEDPRRSAGSGEYVVTDGTNWQWLVMQSGSVMHVHAMNVCDGDLVAATGSWTGQLHRLKRQGSWKVQYDYPAAESSFSRIVSVTQLDDDCVVGASARGKNEAKLFVLKGDTRNPVDGIPNSDRVDSLTEHQQSIFAFADTGSERQLIRYDGSQSHVVAMPENHRPRAMHSDGHNLWLVTHKKDSDVMVGNLWKYAGNNEFKVVQQFPQVPISITSLNGVLAIGSYAKSGGELLLYRESRLQAVEEVPATSLQTKTGAAELDSALVDNLYQELQDIVTNPQNTADYARELRRSLGRHAEIKTLEFGAALTRVLSVPIEGSPTTMFTGQSISRQDLIRWFLITTLAINGHGRVDPAWINSNIDLETPDSGKVFDPAIASVVASGWLQQNDKETLRALFTRLNSTADPLWVRADVVGALTALTDQRFGYDLAEWNRWWSNHQ